MPQVIISLITKEFSLFYKIISLVMALNTLSQAITSIAFTIPHTYGYVIMVSALLALELILFQFLFADRIRRKIFNKEWMLKHFGEVHNREVGKDVPINQNGFPDTGSGFYSQKLSYREWFDLNNAQRVHYNFLEMAPSTFVCLLLAGLYYPMQSALIGLVIAVSRLFYGIGYMTYGPKGRTIGAFGNDICLLALFYLTGMTGWKVANGKSP